MIKGAHFGSIGSVIAALLLLGACVQQPVQLPEPVPPSADACGASVLQGLVGQGGSVLAAMRLPDGTRIIRPGMAVTMDYRPDRLNIDLDEQDRITRVHCT